MKRIATSLICLAFISPCIAQGYYMEFKMTSLNNKNGVSGTSKTYHQNGDTRVENSMQVSGMPGGSMEVVTLILAKSPNTVYILNTASKTYTEISAGASDEYKDYTERDYEVTVVGKETVNGYKTTHVKVRVKGQKNEMEFWTTKDITGFQEYNSIKTKYSQPSLYKALAAKDADGFAVRIRTVEKGDEVQLDLVKAEKRNIPPALLSLAGYTKGVSMDLSNPGNLQQMMQQFQNMTPEQRKAFEEQMKNMYKPRN